MQNDYLQDPAKTLQKGNVPFDFAGLSDTFDNTPPIEPQFRAAIDNLAEGFTICSPVKDRSGKIIDFICCYANNSLARIAKIEKSVLIGKRMSDILPDIQNRKLFQTSCEAIQNNETKILPAVYFDETVGGKGIDGSFDITVTNFQCGVVITFHEVTEQRNIQKNLVRERELLEKIIDSIPVMITLYDTERKKFRFNEEVHRCLGWSKEDAEEGDFMEKVYPDPVYRQSVADYMQSFEKGWREFILMAKDGTQFESAWSNIKLPDNTMVGIGIDLRNMKQTERQLRESQTRLLEAQRLAHVGSFTYDAATNMLEWTDELFRILERDLGKGHPSFAEIMAYIHPDDRNFVSARLKEAEEQKTSINMEYRVITESGVCKFLRYIGTPIFDENGKFIKRFGTALDITEAKKTELKLMKTLEELERSNQELEQFAYVASHDLQEPIRMVSNFAKLLEKQYSGRFDDNADKYISYLISGSKRMQSLINDLLLYARITTKAQPLISTNLNQVLENVLLDLRMAIDEKNASVYYDKLPEIKADPVQMRQLFQNLIANAIKFNSCQDPEISIRVEKKHNEWLFSIRDNGIGINPKFHERIFVIFQRLHERNKYSGTGIGLALCKKIVERHKGRIWVESKEGQGATFYFTIPLKT